MNRSLKMDLKMVFRGLKYVKIHTSNQPSINGILWFELFVSILDDENSKPCKQAYFKYLL